MIKVLIIKFFILFLCYHSLYSQTECPTKNLYRTNFINNVKDSSRLSLTLFFLVKPDSLIISFDPNGKSDFLSFRVLNKQCFWDDNFLEGKSIFKLMLGDVIESKYPTLIIQENKKKGTYIELLYENSEKRVFSKL
jgi:hypothetical protein